MAEILRGEAAAEGIMRDLTARAEKLRARGIRPCLAILRVGERPSDMAYERAAVKRCGRLGIRTKYIRLAADCTKIFNLDTVFGITDSCNGSTVTNSSRNSTAKKIEFIGFGYCNNKVCFLNSCFNLNSEACAVSNNAHNIIKSRYLVYFIAVLINYCYIVALCTELFNKSYSYS